MSYNSPNPNDYGGSQIQGGGFSSDYKNDNANVESGTASVNRGDNHEWGLMPLTIKQIINAPSPAKDQSLEIDGREVSNVRHFFFYV